MKGSTKPLEAHDSAASPSAVRADSKSLEVPREASPAAKAGFEAVITEIRDLEGTIHFHDQSTPFWGTVEGVDPSDAAAPLPQEQAAWKQRAEVVAELYVRAAVLHDGCTVAPIYLPAPPPLAGEDLQLCLRWVKPHQAALRARVDDMISRHAAQSGDGDMWRGFVMSAAKRLHDQHVRDFNARNRF